MSSRAALVPTSEMEKILTPAISVSRAGKMAQSSMHISALVRSGVAAFHKKTVSHRPIEISVAEVVDPETLEAFGSCPSTEDRGRNTEMCSSPRGHPDLEQRILRVMEEDKTEKFQNSMASALRSAAPAMSFSTTTAESVPNNSLKTSSLTPRVVGTQPAVVLPMRPETRDGSLKVKANMDGTSSFKSSERFVTPSTDMPPIGHYRPKYNVVEHKQRGANVRGRIWLDGRKNPGSEEQRSNGGDAGQTKDVPPITNTVPSPPRERSGGSSAVRDPKMQMSSMFKSQVPNAAQRPAVPLQGADVVYDVVDECLSNHPNHKSKFVAINGMTGRPQLATKKSTAAPDVMYHICKPTGTASGVMFQRQISREKAQRSIAPRHANDACVPPATNALGAPIPQGSELYDTSLSGDLKYKRIVTGPGFEKQTPRRPMRDGAMRSDAFFDAAEGKQDTRISARAMPNIKFENFSKREFPEKVGPAHDLSYDVDYKCDVFAPRQRTTNIRSSPNTAPSTKNGGAHDKGISDPPPLDAVRPRIPHGMLMGRQMSRSTAAISRTRMAQTLDVQYAADSTLTQPRIKGNPRLLTHMSRDRRAQVFSLKRNDNVEYYDTHYANFLPRQNTGNVSFAKSVARDEQVSGRGLLIDNDAGRKVISAMPGPGSYEPSHRPDAARSPVHKFSETVRVT